MSEYSWQGKGAHAATRAHYPQRFINQHLAPLFFHRTIDKSTVPDVEIPSEEHFWEQNSNVVFGNIRLSDFLVTDWFPRAPGVYWSQYGRAARENAWTNGSYRDPELGNYFSPESKLALIEDGGIGAVRLRPRKIDGEDCWLASAVKLHRVDDCSGGIPLAIPNSLLQIAGVTWGDTVDIRGRVRFLQDAGLEEVASRVHHMRPLIVFVDELKGLDARQSTKLTISPVTLFESKERSSRDYSPGVQYTFVRCTAGLDSELDAAAEWMQKYAAKYGGTLITNFDEQRPLLADAPLSYQRLVAKTYDRAVIQRFSGTIQVDRIDRFIQESVTTQYYGDIHMGHNINVGGSAIINIDSVLSNVTQQIGAAPGLNATQKSELESLVQSLKGDLERIKASYPDETKEIAAALEKAVNNASKAPQERKSSLLRLSAKGLKEAAELVKDIAPGILTTATLIAKFVVGL